MSTQIIVMHRLRMLRRARGLPWTLLGTGATAAVFCLAASCVVQQRLQSRQAVMSKGIADLRVQLDAVERQNAPDVHGDSLVDFASKFPAVADARPVLTELERSAAYAGVVMGGVQLQERAATSELLGRTDLTVSLRGSYANLKGVVAEVLDRFPNVTLVQWRLRRVTQPAELETIVALALWGGAMPATGSDIQPPAGKVR